MQPEMKSTTGFSDNLFDSNSSSETNNPERETTDNDRDRVSRLHYFCLRPGRQRVLVWTRPRKSKVPGLRAIPANRRIQPDLLNLPVTRFGFIS